MSTFKIDFSDLWTYDSDNLDERLPLHRLAEGDEHVHGQLYIEVSGKALPHLGFFGSDDVCFNEWIFELKSAWMELRSSAHGRYSYDECEQGQPAFLFEREDSALLVSIVDSQCSGGRADPEWSRVRCEFSDFERSIDVFLSSFRLHLMQQAPDISEEWWSRTVKRFT